MHLCVLCFVLNPLKEQAGIAVKLQCSLSFVKQERLTVALHVLAYREDIHAESNIL